MCVHLKQKASGLITRPTGSKTRIITEGRHRGNGDPRGASEPNKEETNQIEECEAEVDQKALFFRLEIVVDHRRELNTEQGSDRNLNTKVILTTDPYTLTRVYMVLLDCDIIPNSSSRLPQLRESVTGVKQRRCSGSVDVTGTSLSLFLCRITPSLP